MVCGAAWRGCLTVTQEIQMGSNPIRTAKLSKYHRRGVGRPCQPVTLENVGSNPIGGAKRLLEGKRSRI